VTAIVNVAEEHQDGVVVAHLSGEVDAANAHEIGARLRAPLTNHHTALIVDLTEVGYLDSAGINLLFTLADELRGRQQALHVVVPEGSPVRRMLSITGFDSAHPTHRTVTDARAATAG
jgi:anti-anti-sigma factor